MKLVYIANIRLPTEKAHGLQIVQNCEAFAGAGAQVELWTPRRVNTPELRAITDVWAHYGVRRNFEHRRLFTVDALAVAPTAKWAFALQYLTFAAAALIAALLARADVYYSRDPLVLLLLSLIIPREKLAYEAHLHAKGRVGARLQSTVVRRVGHVFAVTRHLADKLIARGADAAHTHVAHDGFRRERFADMPTQAEARRELGWDERLFIIGYVGRLHTLGVDKGVGTLVDAAASLDNIALAVVGGPDDMANALRDRWLRLGGASERFLSVGHVPPEHVPLHLAAFDACAMPFPFTEHFAYYASPLKLFEYMAAGRVILTSDLPSVREVVTDGESALLCPPGDTEAWAAAVARLRNDPDLRERLAQNARALADDYSWDARANMILDHLTDDAGATRRVVPTPKHHP